MKVEVLSNVPTTIFTADNVLLEMLAAKACLDTEVDVVPTSKLQFFTLERTVVITRTNTVTKPVVVSADGTITHISVPLPVGYDEGSFMILSKDDLSIHGSFAGPKALPMAGAVERRIIKIVREAFPNEEVTLHSNSVSILRKKNPIVNKLAGFSSGITAKGAEFFGSVWFNFDKAAYAAQAALGHTWHEELATTSFAAEGNNLVNKMQLIQDIVARLKEAFPGETFEGGLV